MTLSGVRGPRPGPLWLVGLAVVALLAIGTAGARESVVLNGPEPVTGQARVVYGDGRPEEVVEILESGGQSWFSARDLSAILGAPRFWRSDLRRLLFRAGAHEASLTVDSEVAVVDGQRPLLLPAPVLERRDRLWVPVDLLLSLPGEGNVWHGQDIAWEASDRVLSVGRPAGRLVDVRSGGAIGDRLELVVEGPLDWRLVAADRGRFVVRLLGLAAVPESLDLSLAEPQFRGLEVSRVADGLEVSFGAGAEALGWQLFRLERPTRLCVLLSQSATDLAEGRIVPFPDMRTFVPIGTASSLDTIMIDPGHGGRDRGTRRKGIDEADAMMDLAEEVASRLESELGLVVFFTRSGDDDLSIEERAARANGSGADVFISLHCDAHPSPAVTGPRAVVARPAPGGGGHVPAPLRDLGFRPWGESQREVLPRSYRLADRLVTELSQGMGVPSRGVEEWPLPLLSAIQIPAVYLEVDTVTGPGAERRIARGRSNMAQAIVRAVDQFRRESP